jgi:hypothetical protein
MHPFASGCALAGVLLFANAVQAAPQHDHETAPAHDHASQATVDQAPAAAQRWQPDAALRKGMGVVHAALDDLRHYELGHMPAKMAGERAGDIAKAVESMFAECKLAPEPDAALHGILVPLLAAARRLAAEPSDVGTVAAMREAVASYPQHFDDPSWSRTDEAAREH